MQKNTPLIDENDKYYCGHCNAEVSFEDTKCPNCGADVSDIEEAVPEKNGPQEVIVTDIKMPFFSMVSFMVKWVIASIPAIIVLIILFAIVSTVFGGLFLGLLR